MPIFHRIDTENRFGIFFVSSSVFRLVGENNDRPRIEIKLNEIQLCDANEATKTAETFARGICLLLPHALRAAKP